MIAIIASYRDYCLYNLYRILYIGTDVAGYPCYAHLPYETLCSAASRRCGTFSAVPCKRRGAWPWLCSPKLAIYTRYILDIMVIYILDRYIYIYILILIILI